MKNKNADAPRSVGRPMAAINIPNRKFTFADLENVNPHVTPLTLRKFLKRDMLTEEGNPKRNSTLVLVKDEQREPNSEKGLGRKCHVYAKRSRLQSKTARKSTATVNVGTSADTPAVTVTDSVPSSPVPVTA